jgi:hypothetical protein
MTAYAFRDRELNSVEIERLRLMLSAFRDGSGQVIVSAAGDSMPGFRDFERSLASAIGGHTPEDKGIFDIYVPTDDLPFGISCKMSKMQSSALPSSFMELSNSAAKFRRRLDDLGIDEHTEPELAGPAIVELVGSWHREVEDATDLEGSRYAVLAHDARWRFFQILAFPLDLELADPKTEVEWALEGKSLNGYVDVDGVTHRLWQCYLNSGGQLKYYPPLKWAEWVTDRFELELPPRSSPAGRAQEYFPELWPS